MSMDRNAKEKELFIDWAKGIQKRKEFLYDSNEESYFVKREEDEKYIWEYNFESVPQLRDLLEDQWEDDKDMEMILTATLVAAIKNKPQTDGIKDEGSLAQKESDETEKLPVDIYNF